MAILALVLWAPRPAGAGGKEEAKKHFEKGVSLFNNDDFDGALVEFMAAYQAQPHYSVRYNLGICYYKLQQYPDAVAEMTAYLMEGKEQIPEDRRNEVEELLMELKDLVAVLDVTASVADAVLYLDGVRVGPLPMDRPLQLNVGKYEVEILADGYEKFLQEVLLPGGTNQKVHAELLALPDTPTDDGPETFAPETKLSVDSSVPGAQVLLDSEIVCPAPCTFRVSPGEHLVTVYEPGYLQWDETVTVVSGQTHELDALLEKASLATSSGHSWVLGSHFSFFLTGGYSITRLGSNDHEIGGSGSYGLGLGGVIILSGRVLLDVGARVQINPIDVYPASSRIGYLFDAFADFGVRIRIVAGLNAGLQVGAGAMVLFNADEQSILFSDPTLDELKNDGFAGFLLRTSVRISYDFPFGLFLFAEPFAFQFTPRFEDHLDEEIRHVIRFQFLGGIGMRQ